MTPERYEAVIELRKALTRVTEKPDEHFDTEACVHVPKGCICMLGKVYRD